MGYMYSGIGFPGMMFMGCIFIIFIAIVIAVIVVAMRSNKDMFGPDTYSSQDAYTGLTQLDDLHKKGVISNEEYEAKKQEMLKRL